MERGLPPARSFLERGRGPLQAGCARRLPPPLPGFSIAGASTRGEGRRGGLEDTCFHAAKLDLEDVGKKWGTPAHPRNVVSDRRREWKHLDNILAGG